VARHLLYVYFLWRTEHGSVAAYLRCGGVVNNQIKKGLLPSLVIKKDFKIGEYLANAKLQART